MLMLNHLVGFGATSPRYPVASYIDNDSSGSATATPSYASQDIGTPSPYRIVVALAFTRDSAGGAHTHSALTLGGNAMTEVVQTNGGGRCVSMWYRLEPTGTSATIAWTASLTIEQSALAVYNIVNAAQLAPRDFSSGATSPSSFSVLPSGVGIAAGIAGNGAIASSGIDAEDFDLNVSGVVNCAAGRAAFPTGGTFASSFDGAGTDASIQAYWR